MSNDSGKSMNDWCNEYHHFFFKEEERLKSVVAAYREKHPESRFSTELEEIRFVFCAMKAMFRFRNTDRDIFLKFLDSNQPFFRNLADGMSKMVEELKKAERSATVSDPLAHLEKALGNKIKNKISSKEFLVEETSLEPVETDTVKFFHEMCHHLKRLSDTMGSVKPPLEDKSGTSKFETYEAILAEALEFINNRPSNNVPTKGDVCYLVDINNQINELIISIKLRIKEPIAPKTLSEDEEYSIFRTAVMVNEYYKRTSIPRSKRITELMEILKSYESAYISALEGRRGDKLIEYLGGILFVVDVTIRKEFPEIFA